MSELVNSYMASSLIQCKCRKDIAKSLPTEMSHPAHNIDNA